MKTVALGFSLVVFLIVLMGVLRTIVEHRFPFFRDFNDTTQQAYILLVLAAAGLFAWTQRDLHIESFEIAGVNASVREMRQKVDTLSDQMEEFF
jgi:hypothetical protein